MLYFEGCPHFPPTLAQVREVLDELAIDAEISVIEVRTGSDARHHRFLGSPTVRVDGADIEPAARSRCDYGLACRRYDGTGSPSRALLVAAFSGTRS